MITKKKVYLDTCILIAFFHEKHPSHKLVKKALGIISTFQNFEAYISYWTLTEMKKVLMKEYKYQDKKAEKIIEKIIETSKLGNLKLNWADIDNNQEYSFKNFFDDLTNLQVSCKEIHLADAIHSAIMANNEIEYIFTTNGKDFMGLKTFTFLEPSQILAFEQ